MNVLDRLRNRPTTEPTDADSPAAPDSAAEAPIPGYDRLADKKVIGQLNQLSQVQLAAVEAHERSNKDRPTVLNKLRWLRGSEPMPGYDELGTEQIFHELASADAGTVRAVREYELKFKGRRDVIDEAGRVLPKSPLSAGEGRAREEKAERVRTGLDPSKN